MTRTCPTCGQPLPGNDTVESLKAACREAGKPVFPSDRVDEATAAFLLGRSPGTLRNWRHQARPIPFNRIGGSRGRVTYRLEDLARHLESEDKE